MGSADEVVAIHGERRHAGAVDAFLVRAVDEAYAARFRTSDYGSGMPLWQRSGEAADVINDLLDLPPHDSPGAPKRPLHGPGTDAGNLWFPGLP
ncbi:hypothetical protein [Saccharomonospora sp.]|uniref:hypothetical protein n=1 Tax=Saccharomonospora sp. TaxID=33913 RepID=UPI002637170B|nr:hypothetical protein [Saccharomonospora sp.]